MPFQRRFFRGCVGRSACSQDHERTAASGSTSLRRGGLTLIELLVSVTLTLIVVFAIVQVFDMLGETMTKGRATIEMAGNLRAVANRLQEDLDNLTCPVRPWIDPAAGQGYFEYVEWTDVTKPASSDRVPVSIDGTPISGQHFGDLGDVLMMTVKATGEPFRGRYRRDPTKPGYEIQESEYAEVIWWPTYDSSTNTATLRRRVLLIRPDLPLAPTTDLQDFYHFNDVSVHVETDGGTVTRIEPNSLSDLTNPRNRFGHFSSDFFPSVTADQSWVFPLDVRYLASMVLGTRGASNRTGDDVVLSDILAFDVRAFDPKAEVRSINNVAVTPSDPGYWITGATATGKGAFVDLAFGVGASGTVGQFAARPDPPIPASDVAAAIVSYDTWSLNFERDGIDQNFESQDPSRPIDEGFDGIDNPDYDHEPRGTPKFGVDDYQERETRPPYNVPLTGIEVRIRMMEFSTRQIRQVSVVGDFTD